MNKELSRRKLTDAVANELTDNPLLLTFGGANKRIFCKSITDEKLKSEVNILEKAFRSSMTQVINQELNILRRNGFIGQELFNQYMHKWLNNNSLPTLSVPIPIIICSEVLE
ncbi:hypothetical protein ACEYW6_20685 [Nostoc sp. UIC 10607]|uniref:hypothetical protein n=1 Tax=Nostoc sp. UIC 10607 TaxID=3045935 RepID=UPI0039A0A00C